MRTALAMDDDVLATFRKRVARQHQRIGAILQARP